MRISTLLGRRSRSTLLATVVASSLGACGKKEPAPAAPPATSAPADTGTPVEDDSRPRRDPEPSSPSSSSAATLTAPAFNRVPADAPLVVVLKPVAVLEALGYTSLIERYGAFLGDAVGPIGELVGADPTRAEGWAKLGVNLAAPAGAWLTDFRPSAVVTFFGLSDRKRFEEKAAELAKKLDVTLGTETVGTAALLTQAGSDRVAALVTDDAVYVVTLYRGTGAADVARQIGQRTAEQSLAGKPGFADLVGTVKSPDGGLYVRFGEVVERLAKRPDPYQRERESLAAQIEEAKKTKQTQLADELTKVLAEFDSTRHDAEQALIQRFLSGLGDLVAGLDASAEGLEVEARVQLGDGAAITKLFKRNDGVLPVLKLAASRPLLSYGATVDAQAGLEVLKAMVAADGGDLDELRGMLKAQADFDLDGDFFAHLDGRVGFALTGDLMAALRSGDPTGVLGGTLILGLKDTDAFAALLAKVGALPALAEVGSWDKDAATLVVKWRGHQISVTVASGYLVVTTDPEAKQRLEGTATFVDQGVNPLLKARLTKPGLGVVFTFEQALVGTWFYAMAGGRSGLMAPVALGESEETRKVRAELEKLDTEITALRTKVEAARMMPLIEGLTKLGTWAQTLGVGDKYLELSVGIYPSGATLAEAVGGLVDVGMNGAGGEPNPDEEKLRELENRRWDLESQLWKAPKPVEFPSDE